MKKISKLGIGILLGCLLTNSLTEKDFEIFKSNLKNKLDKVEPKLVQYFYELNNISKSQDEFLYDDKDDKKIILKLQEIKEEIEKTKAEELTKLIFENLEDDEENYE